MGFIVVLLENSLNNSNEVKYTVFNSLVQMYVDLIMT